MPMPPPPQSSSKLNPNAAPYAPPPPVPESSSSASQHKPVKRVDLNDEGKYDVSALFKFSSTHPIFFSSLHDFYDHPTH